MNGPELAARLCPPYDVIDSAERKRLAESDPHNAVAVVLPATEDGTDAYEHAAHLLDDWLAEDACAVDDTRALYVYEMSAGDGAATRGLVGAVELRDPADGVILPHENTMAGPVADRLGADVGDRSQRRTHLSRVRRWRPGIRDRRRRRRRRAARADGHTRTASGTPCGQSPARPRSTRSRDDLANRRALIADGHHRYATYRELQQRLRSERGPGPWDYGLTLLVDSTNYGPQVHAIHRVLPGLTLADLIDRTAAAGLTVDDVGSADAGLAGAATQDGFAAVLDRRWSRRSDQRSRRPRG